MARKTCKTCQNKSRCLEATRWYPCRDYREEGRRKRGKKNGKRSIKAAGMVVLAE